MWGTFRALMIGATVLVMASGVEAASIQSSGAIALGCSVGMCMPAASQVGTTSALASLSTSDAFYQYSGTSSASVLGGGNQINTSNSLTVQSLQYSPHTTGFLTAESKGSASDAIFLYAPSGAGTIVFNFFLNLNGGQNGGSTVTFDGTSYFGSQFGTHSLSLPFTNNIAIPFNVTVVTDTAAVLGQGNNLCCEDSSGTFGVSYISVLDQMNNPVQQYGYRTVSGFNLGFSGTQVPEPCTVLLLLSGGAALLLKRNSRAI